MNKAYVISLLIIGLFSVINLVSAANSVNIINPLNGVNNFSDLLQNIVTQVGLVIATLGTIMIIVAGIFYLTSAGNPERMSMAKKTIAYAIIGIIIGIIASIIPNMIKQIIGAS